MDYMLDPPLYEDSYPCTQEELLRREYEEFVLSLPGNEFMSWKEYQDMVAEQERQIAVEREVYWACVEIHEEEDNLPF